MTPFLAAILLAMTSVAASAETWTGAVRMIDADTIDVGGPAHVRLLGIDAAEADQTCRDASGAAHACGEMATAQAKALYEGRVAACDVRARDRFGRALATCRVADQDIGADLVRRGLAQAFRDDRTYAEDEKEARLLGRGLWRYEMLSPAAWRDARRATPAAEEQVRPAVGGCAIKGNVSEGGRIYHLPGMRDYDRTTIREDRGERWFCTEREAQGAGWRRARR